MCHLLVMSKNIVSSQCVLSNSSICNAGKSYCENGKSIWTQVTPTLYRNFLFKIQWNALTLVGRIMTE